MVENEPDFIRHSKWYDFILCNYTALALYVKNCIYYRKKVRPISDSIERHREAIDKLEIAYYSKQGFISPQALEKDIILEVTNDIYST